MLKNLACEGVEGHSVFERYLQLPGNSSGRLSRDDLEGLKDQKNMVENVDLQGKCSQKEEVVKSVYCC